ncbi:hypothetical protein SLEP1_g5240 [Rubroshorea leprosula]|uniref:Uncharacterized protein n=1 Tax=Rubroshorea leprosula TaxID=152421 RepID=A0AAV5HX84_9ROSI|nr:hypothetical protein SLEP1_g5240 [Rubroshorea leprosula]
MSSEGTMSVIGSEVMPLEYGNMDSESCPSPSSSERTLEEKRTYDPKLDIVSEVKGYVNELGSRGSLRGLVGNCDLPHHVLIRLAGVNERACSAPQDHWMPMYIHYLAAGLRGKGEKGWYYFGPQSSSKENISLFTAGPSSIKGWKEKFFFVDDTEWSMKDTEVEQLSAWKAKKAKQNNYKLNEDEVEEVGKLVREEGELVDIMYLTSAETIKAAKLYGPSSLREAEMDGFLNAAGGLAIPKKLRKKSKTSTAAEKGVAETKRLSSTSAQALEMQPRPEPMRRSSEEASEEVAPLQRKKRKMAEPEARRDEVVEFVPRPSPQEVDPEVREREEAEVQGPGKGKELIPPPSFQKSLFDATNITRAKRFLNATLPEVDRRQVRDEPVSQLGARIVRHSLEELLKEKEELQKEKKELQKKNQDMQRKLDEFLPSVTEHQNDNDTLSTRLVFEERKKKICEDKLKTQDKYIDNMKKGVAKLKKNMNLLVHNGMEKHIGNFLNSSTFENIINLYQLPTTILAFTDCRKKVKAQYPKVDVTTFTFGKQEEGVEEDGESLSVDFRPLIKLRWERDTEGRTIFPPAFDAELVAVEEEEGGQDAEVENQIDPAEVQPPEVHPVSSNEEQLAPPEVEAPPLHAGDEPPQPPLPTEEQPPPSAD